MASISAEPARSDKAIPVTAKNFARAETDRYFARIVADGGFGKFKHERAPMAIDRQMVIRMNRDTLYSSAVFDLDAGPVTIVLPDCGKRFMSLLVINQDHYTQPVVYAPSSYTFTRQQAGTRYVMAAVRTLADPAAPADVRAANALQDLIRVKQAAVGAFVVPVWDKVTQDKVREALLVLAANSGLTMEQGFGAKDKVDPIAHLLCTAAGWGGNPREAAVYVSVQPQHNDGSRLYQLKIRDVPVDGFWSISVYNEKGFFEKNDLDSYSLNNLTAKPDSDGGFTVQFGGCTRQTANCLVTAPGWSYIVRMYRPRAPVIAGTWKFPEAQPL
jgi:hypothetical protein